MARVEIEVITRLPCLRFVEHVVHDDDGTILHGRRALAAKWDALPAEPSFDQLTVFQTYKYWMPAEQQQQLDQLVRTTLQAQVVHGALQDDDGNRKRLRKKQAASSSSSLFD